MLVNDQLQHALEHDLTIDIVTVGRNSGEAHTVEIWFTRVDGRTFITGTPGRRDWYANLLKEPQFTFCFKESVKATVAARAVPIIDHAERWQILSAPAMAWYQTQVNSVANLVAGSPLIEVFFAAEGKSAAF